MFTHPIFEVFTLLENASISTRVLPVAIRWYQQEFDVEEKLMRPMIIIFSFPVHTAFPIFASALVAPSLSLQVRAATGVRLSDVAPVGRIAAEA